MLTNNKLLEGYDWASLGDALVVDVGGAQGHIAFALARHYGNLRIVVEDMDKVVEGCEAPGDLAAPGRISFRAHDLFAEQTVKGDVFLFRWIMHNWPDSFCVRILQVRTAMLLEVGRGAFGLVTYSPAIGTNSCHEAGRQGDHPRNMHA